MTVTAVNKLFTWLEPSDDGHRVYKQTWQVFTDDKNDGPLIAAHANGLPSPGDPYSWGNEYDQYAWCMPVPSVRLTNEDHAFHRQWTLEYTFSTRPRRDTPQEQDSPLDAPWEYESTSDESEEEVGFANDINGVGPVAMMTSVLDPLSAITIKNHNKLQLKKNFASINQAWILYARGSVNKYPITIMGITYNARVLRMRQLDFVRNRSAVGFYYPVTFGIDIDPNTWDLMIPNRGYKQRRSHIVGPPKKLDDTELITDTVTGRPLPEPVYLDQNGVPIEADANGNIMPVFRRYRQKREFNWSLFGMPTSG